MQDAARALWPGALRLEPVTGGLFNEVARVTASTGVHYLKRFCDQAASGTFPPLPTSADQRCEVAAAWHAHAERAAAACPAVAVPALLAVLPGRKLVAMRAVAGTPLHSALVAGDGACEAALPPLIEWLAAFHAADLQPRAGLIAASDPFKRFKIDLQYVKVLAEAPAPLHAAAARFIDAYLDERTDPLHGDLNSRNVLADGDTPAVIDFEQGQFGEGSYDLAYILCEFAISRLRAGENPEALLTRIWERYCAARAWSTGGARFTRWRIHLGFQTLYRLAGPSRQVWTGHLDARAQSAVRQWSIDQLQRWLR